MKTRTYFIGIFTFLVLFTLIMGMYVAPHAYGAEVAKDLGGRITGLSIFSQGSLRDNVFVISASVVLGISIVYLLLRVVSAFIFTAKE